MKNKVLALIFIVICFCIITYLLKLYYPREIKILKKLTIEAQPNFDFSKQNISLLIKAMKN